MMRQATPASAPPAAALAAAVTPTIYPTAHTFRPAWLLKKYGSGASVFLPRASFFFLFRQARRASRDAARLLR